MNLFCLLTRVSGHQRGCLPAARAQKVHPADMVYNGLPNLTHVGCLQGNMDAAVKACYTFLTVDMKLTRDAFMVDSAAKAGAASNQARLTLSYVKGCKVPGNFGSI